MEKLISVFGLAVMLGVNYLFSSSRKDISWRTVFSGLLLQLTLAFIILKTQVGHTVFQFLKDIAVSILAFGNEGSNFVFGPLSKFEVLAKGFGGGQHGFVFFTMVLPTIIFISALMSVMYHIGVMQKLVQYAALVMTKIMKTSGAESLAAAANIFAGQTEAPLVVRPYLAKMTRSELLTLMTGGMATVAGGVLVAYIGMGVDAGHLLAASVMSAPAALVCAKMLIPETQKPETQGMAIKADIKKSENIIDAAAVGANEGLFLALNVGGMLVAFISLIAMANHLLMWMGSMVGLPQLSFEYITGNLFAPFAYMMGILDWSEAVKVGSLLGKKVVINEFVAYVDLVGMKETLSPRAFVISTYALCGFSNFSSIAIQVGGIGSLVKERRGELAKLGMRSLLGGTLACMMTACVAGLFV